MFINNSRCPVDIRKMFSQNKMQEIDNIIDKFQEKHILVIGDVMIDEYIIGEVSRINPEAPVPVLDTQKTEHRLGGAANVANNIVSLGGKCTLIGQIGKDETKEILIKKLNDKEIRYFLIENENIPTIKKTRIIARNQQVIRIDNENIIEIKDEEADKIIEKIKENNFDIILISDYNKGIITPYLMSKLKELNKKLIVDPKPENIEYYKDTFIISPNLKEGKEITKEKDINKIGEKITKNFNTKLILRCGEKGAYLFEEQETHYFPTKAKEIYDVSGAGDTFMATLALAISSNSNLHESIILGNHAAGIVIGKLGTSTLSTNELKKSFSIQETKIKHLSEIKEIVEKLKNNNKKIVFTNGCFDILHAGHTHLLKEAKSLGDTLILGLNTDESINRIKGPTRPINNGAERAEVLASLESVDYIIFFDEDTPLNLIKEIIPHKLVKASDYEESGVVGGDIVKQHGGEVELIRLKEGKSTTNLINKIKNSSNNKL